MPTYSNMLSFLTGGAFNVPPKRPTSSDRPHRELKRPKPENFHYPFEDIEAEASPSYGQLPKLIYSTSDSSEDYEVLEAPFETPRRAAKPVGESILPLPRKPGEQHGKTSKKGKEKAGEKDKAADPAVQSALRKALVGPSLIPIPEWEDWDAPVYAITDVEIRDHVWRIMDRIQALASTYFSFELRFPAGKAARSTENEKLAAALVVQGMDTATVGLIAKVASGGPGGYEGWEVVFVDSEKRTALVCGMIGMLVVQHVCMHLFFGGKENDLLELEQVARELKDGDGFDRNKKFAHVVRHALGLDDEPIATHRTRPPNPKTINLPPRFLLAVEGLSLRIYAHISPILCLQTYSSTSPIDAHDADPILNTTPEIATSIYTDIQRIVFRAGLINLATRLDKRTVYHWTPIAKDDTFQPSRMECYNADKMSTSNPLDPSYKFPRGKPDAEKEIIQAFEPLTHFALMPGLTAYRKGGWQFRNGTYMHVDRETKQDPGGFPAFGFAADEEYDTESDSIFSSAFNFDEDGTFVEKERRKEEHYGSESAEGMGIRQRGLCTAWTYVRWGRPKYEGGKETPAEVHGRSWREPGWVDFVDYVRYAHRFLGGEEEPVPVPEMVPVEGEENDIETDDETHGTMKSPVQSKASGSTTAKTTVSARGAGRGRGRGRGKGTSGRGAASRGRGRERGRGRGRGRGKRKGKAEDSPSEISAEVRPTRRVSGRGKK